MGSGLGAGALAGVAGYVLRDGDVHFLAGGGLDKRNLQVVAQVRARMGPGSSPGGRAEAEEILENISERGKDVFEPAETGEPRALEAFDAVPVVNFAFVGIAEHFIGLGGEFELLLALPVSGVSVRVALHGDLAVAFFYLIGRGIFGH